MTAQQPTVDDAKRYWPSNSKCRGDNQTPLFEFDYECAGDCGKQRPIGIPVR